MAQRIDHDPVARQQDGESWRLAVLGLEQSSGGPVIDR
jgi:hypothetical protein